MADSTILPSVESLLPHEAPMILIDKLIHVDTSTVHCQVFISEHSPFYDQQQEHVGAWVGIEYMAQTVAAWSGFQAFSNNQPPPIGFLLGTRCYKVDCDSFNKGQILDIYAEQMMESEGMSAFSCQIKSNNQLLAEAQLNAFSPNKEQLQTMLKGTTDE